MIYKYEKGKKKRKEDSEAKVGKQWRSRVGWLYPYLPDKAISPIHFNSPSSNAVLSPLLRFSFRPPLISVGSVRWGSPSSPRIRFLFLFLFLFQFAKCFVCFSIFQCRTLLRNGFFFSFFVLGLGFELMVILVGSF